MLFQYLINTNLIVIHFLLILVCSIFICHFVVLQSCLIVFACVYIVFYFIYILIHQVKDKMINIVLATSIFFYVFQFS